MLTSLQPLLQPVEFLQCGEGCQVVDIEVAEFVHDGMLFRGEEGSLLFAFLFRGAFGDFGFARIVEVVRFERLQDDLRAVGQQGGRLRFISMSIADGHCPNTVFATSNRSGYSPRRRGWIGRELWSLGLSANRGCRLKGRIMRTISVDQARMELPEVLTEIEAGGEVIIARGEKPIARLVPFVSEAKPRRPKVGVLRGGPFSIPDQVVAPLTAEELKEWDL